MRGAPAPIYKSLLRRRTLLDAPFELVVITVGLFTTATTLSLLKGYWGLASIEAVAGILAVVLLRLSVKKDPFGLFVYAESIPLQAHYKAQQPYTAQNYSYKRRRT